MDLSTQTPEVVRIRSIYTDGCLSFLANAAVVNLNEGYGCKQKAPGQPRVCILWTWNLERNRTSNLQPQNSSGSTPTQADGSEIRISYFGRPAKFADDASGPCHQLTSPAASAFQTSQQRSKSGRQRCLMLEECELTAHQASIALPKYFDIGVRRNTRSVTDFDDSGHARAGDQVASRSASSRSSSESYPITAAYGLKNVQNQLDTSTLGN